MLNGGYRKGAHFDRKGKRFVIFAPVALAMIAGETLPPQLRARCIQIAMQRSDGARKLRRFDANNTRDFDAVYGQIWHWARNAVIDLDPDLPAELRHKVADSWRALIAIADAFGADWGKCARAAAVALSAHQEEDFGVRLLSDVRTIFETTAVDFMPSKVLVSALNELDDAPWSEWRGMRGNQYPRRFHTGRVGATARPLRHQVTFNLAGRTAPAGQQPQGLSPRAVSNRLGHVLSFSRHTGTR